MKTEFLIADKRNPSMGLNNKVCKKTEYWCRLHKVFLSEKDVEMKKCKCKPDFDMIGTHSCGNLERRQWE